MTNVALVLAPLMCAVVLLLSGTAKVGDRTATRDAFISMDVPAALRSERLVAALPYLEVALGVLMLLTWSWLLAAAAAATTVLFAVYWVLVLRVLRRGEVVDCGCFGALGDDRVSTVTLARNSMLVLLALLTTAFGAAGSGLFPAVRDFSAGDWWWLVLAVAVAVTSVLVVGVRGSEEEAAIDTELLDYERVPIPFAMLEDESGTRTTLRQLASQRPQLLFFLSTYCGACEGIAAQLPDWTSGLGPVEISTVFTDPLEDLPARLRQVGVPARLDIEGGATQTFAPTGRPAAVLLGADGSLAGGPVVGTAEVRAFVADIEAELATVQGSPEPSEAPVEPVRLVHEHATPSGGHGSDDGHGHA